MTSALVFDDVSKTYRGAATRGTLRDDLAATARRLLGGRREAREAVHALDRVSFEIREGESVALIGENGAGKTTALKIATRIAYPTSGTVRVRGRVGALIEVGSGMHPELTGRENVQLYGRMLGLSGADIRRRFDEIAEFSAIGVAIDRPVKQYSSGMQLRLGFAVAAHLEPDIFIVDEAIAVGDAGFQHRCVERMSQLVREGRTLIFVSHDMSAVETLCQRALLLDAGGVVADEAAPDVVRQYLRTLSLRRTPLGPASDIQTNDSGITIDEVDVSNCTGDHLRTGGDLTVRVRYQTTGPIPSPILSFGIGESRHRILTLASNLVDDERPAVLDGTGHIECHFPSLPLLPRIYEVWMSIRGQHGYGDLVDWQRIASFEIVDPAPSRAGAVVATLQAAPLAVPYKWNITAEEPVEQSEQR